MQKKKFQSINSDAFFPLKQWPKDVRLLFWRKPLGDMHTFKLVLFLVGNGYSQDLICPWILLSQAWESPEQAEKWA